MKIQNREYQQKARHWCNRQLNQGNNPLLVMGGGSGKTKTTIQTIQDRISLKKKILVVVPQIEILHQWIDDCSTNNISYGYINDEGVVGRDKDVYIAMFQSLAKMLDRLPERFIKSFDEIIIDEAHLSGAYSYEQIFEYLSHCQRLGLTASPVRMDNKPLSLYFTHMFSPIKNTELKKKGFLCAPRIALPDEYSFLIPKNPDEINIDDQRELIQPKKIIGDMVQFYRETFSGLPVIAPTTGFEQAQKIQKMYKSDNQKVEHLHSGLNKYDRKKIITDIRRGRINILLTHGIGVMGLDIPGLYGSIWFTLTGSLARWIQYNARAARPHPENPEKKEYILCDPCGNLILHGLPDYDRDWLKFFNQGYEIGEDIKESFSMKECPCCGNMNSLENIKCWICEYDFDTMLDADGNVVEKKKRKLPKFIDGRLVFLDEELNNLRGDDVSNRNDNIHNNMDGRDMGIHKNSELITPTKAEKIDILTRDLTGLKLNSKFKQGIEWLK